MGVDLMEIGVKVRKGVIFTIKGCFRSVCSHPFLVGMLCFLIFLYRTSPFIFHLLVSASPVLVCTAVLLGTLLSFGQPNIPEIEIEEKTTVEAVSIRTGVLGDATVVEKNESHYVERFIDNRWDEKEKSAGKLGEVLRDEGSDDTAPLIEERSRESDGEKEGGERELGDLRFKGKSEWIEERLNNEDVREDHHLYSSVAEVNGELVGSDDEKSEAESFDSEKVNVDSLDSPPRSPWARAAEREDEEKEESEKERDEDDEVSDSDSESDCAESSSPDASMADIMPMLDELHPLLDEEGHQTVHLSRGSSDVASDKSLKSSHHHSDDESENHEDLEEAGDDDDHEDGEDEEDAHEDKDGETKSAITWTEQDQKNLMDLGSSEIERNQRLENLILRRRARKSTNLFAEKNLIDLDSSDLPFNIAPISTRRLNPFDLPQDNYDDLGLPPIPGSAPSVLLQRRNPFDIPYDSSEEKPDLKGDVFQEEFTSQSREPFFRRHESFNVGPSIFAPRKQDVKMRPYFIPERTISEESSSSLFQRQSSELSESKVSSIPETESITSIEDLEDKKLPEIDCLPESGVLERTKEVAEEGPSGDLELISRQEIDTDEDVHEERDMISKLESVSEHIGHGSESSEDEDYLELTHVEKRDVQVEETQMEDVTDHYERGTTSQYVESRYTRDSSSSSLSEESERVFIDTEGEGLSMVEGRRDDGDEEPIISTQTSLGSTDLNISSPLVNNISQRAPVYDSSPRVLSKNASSSSISTDVLDLGSTPVDKPTASSVEGESEGSCREIETDIPRNIEMLPDSSISHPVAAESRMEKHILGEVSVSVDDKNIDTEVKSSGNQDLEQAEVKHLLLSESHGLTEASETQFECSNTVDETVQLPDSDADIQHETHEKLISMLPSEGNTSLFYDNAIQEPDFNYLDEVQESSTPVESFSDGQITHDLDMPEVQELNCYTNSPSSPQLTSVPPSGIETNSSRFDVQTVFEEADEIKEIDDGLLSELDSVGDFSTRAFGSGTSEFDKHVDSVGEESLFTTHHAETSSTRLEEVTNFLLSEESGDHIDVYEQDEACIPEIQTYQSSKGENIVVPKFNENDHESPYQGTSGEETPSNDNEFLPSHLSVNHNHEDTEVQPIENIGVVAKEAELASAETEAIVEVAEVSCQGQVDADTTADMHELEASSIEDIDLAFNQSSSKEIEDHTELQNHEDTVSAVPEVLSIDDTDAVPTKAESTFVETEIRTGIVDTDTTSGMTELEARAIEDIDLAFNQSSSKEIEDHTELQNHEDTVSAVPEVLSIDDTDAVPTKAESTFVETEIMTGIVDTDTTSGMTELEARAIEDIDLAFNHIRPEASEKPLVLEQADADTPSVMPEHEATEIEDIALASEQISSAEIEKHVVLEPSPAELHNYEDMKSGIPEQEVLLEEDAHAAPKQTESPSVEPAVAVAAADASSQDRVHTETTSESTEIDASTVEEIGLANEKRVDLVPVDMDSTSRTAEIEASLVEATNQAFKHVGSGETEDRDCLEPLQPDLVSRETISENSEDTCVPLSTNETSNVEVVPDSDATTDDKKTAEIITGGDGLHDSVDITKNSEDAVLHSDRSAMVSVDHTLHVVESGETQGASSSELHVAEAVPSEGTTLPPNQALDGETREQVKLKSDDESVEVEADNKMGPSKEKSSAISAFQSEKPNHEDEAVKDLHSPSSGKGKGNLSRSSSSSSSSSSDSSSSDSDKE